MGKETRNVENLNDVTLSRSKTGTLYVAVEVSDKSWIIGNGDPDEPGKTGMHSLAPAYTAGSVAKVERADARPGDPPPVLTHTGVQAAQSPAVATCRSRAITLA